MILSKLSGAFGALSAGALALAVAGFGCVGGTPPESDGSASGGSGTSGPEPGDDDPSGPPPAPPSGRTVKAHVVAIDQVHVYNRFGAYNPAGMMYALERDVVAIDGSKSVCAGNARLREDKRPRPLVLRANVGDRLVITFTNLLAPSPPDDDSPATREASIHVNGLQIENIQSLGGDVGNDPSSLVAPGQTITYEIVADREGVFFMHSAGAMTGGQGLGGQIVQGLFGTVNVEPPGSKWYRSQVTAHDLARVTVGTNPNGTPRIDYDEVDDDGVPILAMLHPETNEIVHGDLSAIVTDVTETEFGTSISPNQGHFREYTVMFHDELNAVQAFPRLENEERFHGVRDGFGVNYGAAGLGAELLANRARIGPTKDCIECKFEEFFLSSWANGDPAMIVEKDGNGKAVEALYPDDPSNVHHGYIGDPVRFRNVHAGPKETHVFHLHGHQWLRTPASDDSILLDAQTVGPGTALTYDIAFGGAGNRNLTPGDAIFHCHLYPHFAQGMWGLMRNHDVFEAGTPDRDLPDGEIEQGTPTPAVVPIPKRAIPPMPTYEPKVVDKGNGTNEIVPAMPGYPHYIGAIAGHRPSQAPYDIEDDGGLPRHLITSVPDAELGERGEFDVRLDEANLKLLPQQGTPEEKAAIEYHAGTLPGAVPVTTLFDFPARAYPTFTPEGTPALFIVNGQPPGPGAPYANPCPPGAKERRYDVAAVQVDGVVNKAGWHDPQMRLSVLEQDVEATYNQTRPPEPLVIRANSGECVVFRGTNLLPDALEEDDFQIFTPTDTVGQHIHLVKFDVTSSDGAANGFNYEDGTFGPQDVVQRIAAANALGGAFAADGALTESGPRVLLTAKPHPRLAFAPLGSQVTLQRWWADPVVNGAGEDRTLRTSFTHDHFAPSSHQQHGLYAALAVEPAGSVWRDPETGDVLGQRPDGGPTSYRADILTANLASGYREFALAIADFALVYDNCGRPVNPPTAMEAALPKAVEHDFNPPADVAPEVLSARDPGTMLVNYRNEPIPLRIADESWDGKFTQKPGEEGEMHNVFRSAIHDDPFTPLLRLYEGDTVQVRLIEGAQEEMHVFTMNGQRWREEPNDPDSGYVGGVPIGLSEHFELLLSSNQPGTKNVLGAVDYMYASAPTDDLWNGVWGLARAFSTVQGNLEPLPDNPVPAVAAPPEPVCPGNAPVRSYTVHAITAKGNLPGDRVVYNDELELYDPDAMLFVKAEHLAAVKAGTRKPEPLVLRAAAGDCIQVTLKNDLPAVLPKTPHWSYNPPITEGFNTNQVRPSNHVSLHAQVVTYDVNSSDGANVGANDVQTVAPGQQRTYTWYAGVRVPNSQGAEVLTPAELGVIALRDMADVVNHGMHGSIGTLVIEPFGATWTPDPDSDAEATVTSGQANGQGQSFREHVSVLQSEVGLHSDKPAFQCEDANLNCGTAIRNLGGEDDSEDSGHRAFNYRTEPIWGRLGLRPETDPNVINGLQLADILSSKVHGDPATPIFTAKVGTPYRFRVTEPSGHARQHAFALWGAEWPHNPWAQGSESRVIGPNSESFAIANQWGVSVQTNWNIVPFFGAGGKFGVPGDYLYLDQSSFAFTDGQWGLFRVTP